MTERIMNHELLGTQVNNSDHGPLFSGYDRVEEKRRLTPTVTGTVDEMPTEGDCFTKLKVIYNTLNFVKSQRSNMSAEISVGGLIGVNGEVNFASEESVSELSLTVLIYSWKDMGSLQCQGAGFIEGQSPNEEKQSLTRYVQTRGDSFLSSYRHGGMFWAAYTFHSKNTEEKNELEAKLKAGGIIKILTFDAEVSGRFENFLQQCNMEYDQEIRVKGIPNLDLTEAGTDPLGFALKFPTLELTSPHILELGFTGFEELRGSSTFEPLAKNRDLLAGPNGLMTQQSVLQRTNKEIELIQQVHERYGRQKEEALTLAQVNVTKDLNSIEKVLEQYKENRTQPLTVPELDSLLLDKPFPSLSYKINYSDTYGGHEGGGAYQTIDLKDWPYYYPRIETLQMKMGPYVNMLKMNLTTMKETAKGLVEVKVDPVIHGHDNGADSGVLNVGVHSIVAEVEGRNGIYVDHLKFTNSDKEAIMAGGSGGGAFPKWKANEKGIDRHLIGFRGKCGHYINNIAFQYLELGPSQWKKEEPSYGLSNISA